MRIISATAGISTAVLDRITAVFFGHIMVAVQHVQTSLAMEAGEKGKDVAMCLNNLTHAAVFPKFVPVAKFNISITKPEVMLQGGKIEILVFEKIVIGGSDAPVTVAEKNIFCVLIQR